MGDKIIEKKNHVPSQEYPLFHREKEKKIELDHEKMIEKVDLHKEQLLEKTRAFFDQELRVFQNKIEIEEDLATLGEQVNENKRVSDLALNIFDHQEKTVDQIDHELMSAFGIVVGRELVGSLYKELIKKFQHPLTGKIDKQAYLHQKKDYATNTPTLLKSSLDRI
jgi:ribonucleotide reductase alpha subunit